jgi:nitroimidazol reductase NimA-like FMN-containing flavoprotein (pyridoxamine 5'-phosphate oxidase superfamily)
MKSAMHRPEFIELSDAESRSLVARNHVGRLAYTFHDRVDIQPVGYVYDDGWIFGRTQVGAKLATLAHHPWCAFEVDEVRGLYDWDSAVARGSFDILDPELGSVDRYVRALELLREVNPDMFSVTDPTPQRSILFGVYVQDITGRGAYVAR